MKTLILSIIMTATSVLAQAQTHTADEKEINRQIDRFFLSWNTHNFEDLADYTTADIDWVNVVGMWWQGRRQVQFAHQTFHRGMFKNTPLTKESVSIRFITNDVAIVHIVNRVGEYYPPDGVNRGSNKAGGDANISLLVFVKKDNNWFITSGENVPVNAMAAHGDPVLRMK